MTFASVGDNQSLPGANSLGSLAVSITGNVYSGKAQWNRHDRSLGQRAATGRIRSAADRPGVPGISGYATDTATFGPSAITGTLRSWF